MDLADIKNKAKNIKLLALDVDGVLTDGRIWFTENGKECKAFNTQDGYGLVALQKFAIEIAVISGRRSDCVTQRMQELRIRHIIQGHSDKLRQLKNLVNELHVCLDRVVYVGDDIPDIPAIKAVGLGVAVANARPEVIACADWVTQCHGGYGAVREVCDLLLASQHIPIKI